MRTLKTDNEEFPYRVMDIYGYTMAYCHSKEEAIDVCKREMFAKEVEDAYTFDTIFKK